MTRSLSQILKRLSVATLALSLLAPMAARADPSAAIDLPPTGGVIGSPSLGPAIGRMAYSGLVALEFPPSGFDVGPRFSAEGMYGFMELAPQLRLDLGARASVDYHSGAVSDLWLIEGVPDAKIRYGVTDELGVYGDLGLGIAVFGAPTTDLALTFQVGGGVTYAVLPNMSLIGEIRFDFYTKSGAGTFIAFPTVGIEIH